MKPRDRVEAAFIELLETAFFGKSLEWAYREGYSLEDVNKSLYNEIKELFPELIEKK